jgi:hypothetical protein
LSFLSSLAAQEDEQLRKLVHINGAQKWSVVAEKIKVRAGCLCWLMAIMIAWGLPLTLGCMCPH